MCIQEDNQGITGIPVLFIVKMSPPKLGKIGVLGGGMIGRSWAMIFASVGYQVQIYDISPEQLKKSIDVSRLN